MEDNYIMLRGKKVPLTDEQVAALIGCKITGCAKVYQKADPFDRVYVGDAYYYIDRFGTVREFTDFMSENDDRLFAVANACVDEEIMKQRALHETLNRLIWRYSEQHSGDSAWDVDNMHYFVSFYDDMEPFVSDLKHVRPFGVVFFRHEEIAKDAIKEVVKPFLAEHPEFVW